MDPIVALSAWISLFLLMSWVVYVFQRRDGMTSLEAWAREGQIKILSAEHRMLPRGAISHWKMTSAFDVRLQYADGTTKTGVVTIVTGLTRDSEKIEFIPDTTVAERYKIQKAQIWGEW